MITILSVLLTVSIFVIAILSYFCYRAAKMMVLYDDILNDITDDNELFMKWADELLSKEVLSRSQEVLFFHNTVNEMRIRIDQHIKNAKAK